MVVAFLMPLKEQSQRVSGVWGIPYICNMNAPIIFNKGLIHLYCIIGNHMVHGKAVFLIRG